MATSMIMIKDNEAYITTTSVESVVKNIKNFRDHTSKIVKTYHNIEICTKSGQLHKISFFTEDERDERFKQIIEFIANNP